MNVLALEDGTDILHQHLIMSVSKVCCKLNCVNYWVIKVIWLIACDLHTVCTSSGNITVASNGSKIKLWLLRNLVIYGRCLERRTNSQCED